MGKVEGEDGGFLEYRCGGGGAERSPDPRFGERHR
jgi:hypothetical protein